MAVVDNKGFRVEQRNISSLKNVTFTARLCQDRAVTSRCVDGRVAVWGAFCSCLGEIRLDFELVWKRSALRQSDRRGGQSVSLL